MHSQRPPAQRLGDLWWLFAHDERGNFRIGQDHFALGLGACVVGELLTQPSALVTGDRDLFADPVVAHVVGDLSEAAGRQIVKPPRVWIEWLAAEHHDRSLRDVEDRMISNGLLMRQGRRLVPADAFIAFAPVTLLVNALRSDESVTDPVRLLAGIGMCCGLSDLISGNGEDMRRPLQLLAMQLPTPLFALVSATDDGVNSLALRRR